MRKSRKNSIGVIYFIGTMALLSILFVGFCFYKLFTSFYTTHLICNKYENSCIVDKKDILGLESTEYNFGVRDLKKAEIIKQKNILMQEVYSLVLTDKNDNNKKYFLTGETATVEEQEKYLTQIDDYLYNHYTNEFELTNSREKLKLIGLAATAVGSLIAVFLLLDCINGIKDFKRRKADKYSDIIKPGGSF